MKVLVLVLSCKKPPYDMLYEAQWRTWDVIEVPGVSTHYYWCDDFDSMPWKLKIALDDVWDHEWDFIFRTNSSSYVDKQRLLAKAETLPKDCYSGIDGGGFASGSGFFLSRHLADYVRKAITWAHQNMIRGSVKVEDEVIGDILHGFGIGVLPGERVDFWPRHFLHHKMIFDACDDDIRNAYHVRCKSTIAAERDWDVTAMEIVHCLKGHEVD